ncbi:putative delta-endotoxin CytB [Rhizoctonia solani 123E]|uniref:Putative delta-endotoxin CytB n=1 Tax=Rhizoctonia solani 123E TaxID=1423351 RepID=A0A074RU05_9AGAM|nr:putative delta-endotoxin CytB [Rhizoctonia solani 123E]
MCEAQRHEVVPPFPFLVLKRVTPIDSHVVSGFCIAGLTFLNKITLFISRTEATFHLWGMLPSNLVPPAKQILKFTCAFLDPKTKRFDWDAYVSRIRQYPTPDLVLEKHAPSTTAPQTDTIKALAGEISNIIKQFARVSLSIDETARRLVEVLTSLGDAQEAGITHYEPGETSSVFVYRIFLAIPHPEIENNIRAVVITIRSQADFAEESTWLSLGAASDHSFSASIDMAMLGATEKFVDPN